MLAPGTRLGPYEIESALGSGGMGAVYRARDSRLERMVAVKIVSPQLADDPAFRHRLQDEARAISRLQHPHICTLHDIGEAEISPGRVVSYLVLELVEGDTLARTLERGPLPIERALTFAVQIADALNAAHRAGVVHGDLKPGNVMISPAGVKLLDFGLARHATSSITSHARDGSTETASVHSTGTVLGTLQYLAPEQLEGREADVRTDVFAFGAVLYEMVAGRKAFAGDTSAAVIAAIMRQPPPVIAAVQPSAPPALDQSSPPALRKTRTTGGRAPAI